MSRDGVGYGEIGPWVAWSGCVCQLVEESRLEVRGKLA